MTYECSGCRKPFQNGELVALANGGRYHTLHYLFDADAGAKDCLERNQLGSGKHEVVVNYRGKFYDILKVARLDSTREIELGVNEAKTGHVIVRGLERLDELEHPVMSFFHRVKRLKSLVGA